MEIKIHNHEITATNWDHDEGRDADVARVQAVDGVATDQEFLLLRRARHVSLTRPLREFLRALDSIEFTGADREEIATWRSNTPDANIIAALPTLDLEGVTGLHVSALRHPEAIAPETLTAIATRLRELVLGGAS